MQQSKYIIDLNEISLEENSALTKTKNNQWFEYAESLSPEQEQDIAYKPQYVAQQATFNKHKVSLACLTSKEAAQAQLLHDIAEREGITLNKKKSLSLKITKKNIEKILINELGETGKQALFTNYSQYLAALAFQVLLDNLGKHPITTFARDFSKNPKNNDITFTVTTYFSGVKDEGDGNQYFFPGIITYQLKVVELESDTKEKLYAFRLDPPYFKASNQALTTLLTKKVDAKQFQVLALNAIEEEISNVFIMLSRYRFNAANLNDQEIKLIYELLIHTNASTAPLEQLTKVRAIIENILNDKILIQKMADVILQQEITDQTPKNILNRQLSLITQILHKPKVQSILSAETYHALSEKIVIIKNLQENSLVPTLIHQSKFSIETNLLPESLFEDPTIIKTEDTIMLSRPIKEEVNWLETNHIDFNALKNDLIQLVPSKSNNIGSLTNKQLEYLYKIGSLEFSRGLRLSAQLPPNISSEAPPADIIAKTINYFHRSGFNWQEMLDITESYDQNITFFAKTLLHQQLGGNTLFSTTNSFPHIYKKDNAIYCSVTIHFSKILINTPEKSTESITFPFTTQLILQLDPQTHTWKINEFSTDKTEAKRLLTTSSPIASPSFAVKVLDAAPTSENITTMPHRDYHCYCKEGRWHLVYKDKDGRVTENILPDTIFNSVSLNKITPDEIKSILEEKLKTLHKRPDDQAIFLKNLLPYRNTAIKTQTLEGNKLIDLLDKNEISLAEVLTAVKDYQRPWQKKLAKHVIQHWEQYRYSIDNITNQPTNNNFVAYLHRTVSKENNRFWLARWLFPNKNARIAKDIIERLGPPLVITAPVNNGPIEGSSSGTTAPGFSDLPQFSVTEQDFIYRKYSFTADDLKDLIEDHTNSRIKVIALRQLLHMAYKEEYPAAHEVVASLNLFSAEELNTINQGKTPIDYSLAALTLFKSQKITLTQCLDLVDAGQPFPGVKPSTINSAQWHKTVASFVIDHITHFKNRKQEFASILRNPNKDFTFYFNLITHPPKKNIRRQLGKLLFNAKNIAQAQELIPAANTSAIIAALEHASGNTSSQRPTSLSSGATASSSATSSTSRLKTNKVKTAIRNLSIFSDGIFSQEENEQSTKSFGEDTGSLVRPSIKPDVD